MGDSQGGTGSGHRAGITPQVIIDAALELSDGPGLDGWSQRDLARHVGVAPSVLYHHVGGRDAVIRGVVERIVAQMVVPAASLHWQDWFRALLYPARPLLLRYPGTAKWLLMHGPSFPTVTGTIDAGVATLASAGFAHPSLVYSAIMNTALQTVSMRDERALVADDGPRDHGAMLAAFLPLRADSPGVGQLIDELIEPMTSDPDRTAQAVHARYFAFVVETMLAGVEETAPRRARGSSAENP